jgi:hypothetical protein
VLTSDGCISFVDVAASAFSGQLQLTFPGCRAVSFATDARANSMAVVCTDGLVRLYDLAVVRARQQGVALSPQLQRLTAAELAAGSGAAASSAGAGAVPLRERGDADNVPQPSRSTSTGKAAAAPAKGSSSTSRHQHVSAQLCVQPLDAPAAALNRHKLQDMLTQFGEFPARYRRLIW